MLLWDWRVYKADSVYWAWSAWDWSMSTCYLEGKICTCDPVSAQIEWSPGGLTPGPKSYLLCGLPREGGWSHICGNSTLNGCSCHWTVRAQLLSLGCAFVRLLRSSHYWVRRHAELTSLLCLVSCVHLGEAGWGFDLLLCSESRSSSCYHQCLFLVAALPPAQSCWTARRSECW